MQEGTNIRLVTAADRDSLGGLWLTFLQEQSALDERVVVSEDALERWQNDFAAWIARDSRHILVAEQQGELVGFTAGVRTSPAPIFAYVPELFVEELFVRPDARRRGIGTALYRAIAEWGAGWGAQRVRLSVLASNESARDFWRVLGLVDLSLTMAAVLPGAPAPASATEKNRIGFSV